MQPRRHVTARAESLPQKGSNLHAGGKEWGGEEFHWEESLRFILSFFREIEMILSLREIEMILSYEKPKSK